MVELIKVGLHGQRSANSCQGLGTVTAMNRDAEFSHQRITDEFVQQPLLRQDWRGNRLEVAIQQSEQRLRIHHVAAGRESNQIREQDHTPFTPTTQTGPAVSTGAQHVTHQIRRHPS